MRFVHDPDCARTLDVAETGDEDLPDYVIPACTCRERQKARKRITAATGTGSRGAMFSEGASLGNGNYYKPNLSSDYSHS